MSLPITPTLRAALLKALEAGNYNAAPEKPVQALGDDPDQLEAHARQHQQECRCVIKDLMSTGHSPSCPERIVRELQK